LGGRRARLCPTPKSHIWAKSGPRAAARRGDAGRRATGVSSVFNGLTLLPPSAPLLLSCVLSAKRVLSCGINARARCVHEPPCSRCRGRQVAWRIRLACSPIEAWGAWQLAFPLRGARAEIFECWSLSGRRAKRADATKTLATRKYSLNWKGAYSEKKPRTPLHNTPDRSK
jgi:hypothetical protein